MTELQSRFDEAVKKRLIAGCPPEKAVGDSCKELGITLTAEVEQHIINVLKHLAAMQDPAFREKQKTLATRIRALMLDGRSTMNAVKQAQESTGIELGEQGEKMLIQALEGEREKMQHVAIDVVSEREFADMTDKRCIFYHLNGKDGWACCQCKEHNRKNQDACTMCGHGRCYQ